MTAWPNNTISVQTNILLKNKYYMLKSMMLSSKTFLNKNVIITGGGSGLGQAIALGFNKLGANVIIIGRDEKKLIETCFDVQSSNFKYRVLDVKDPLKIKEFYQSIPQPDILINNAAANFLCPSHKLTPNGINSIIQTNLYGTLNMTLEFQKHTPKGVIGNITTTYADTGSKFVLPSAVSKAGINTMIKSLAAEWGPHYRLFGVAPGPIYTEGAFSRLDPKNKFLNKLIQKNPLKRIGEKEELVNLVTYLSSDYASWINGEIVRIDGGELNENSGEFNNV